MIVGDANLCEVSTFLKIGSTAIVLKMIEDRFLPDLTVASPVQALHEISRDTSCTHEIGLADGRRVNAVQLQWEYLEHAKKYVEREDDTPEHREVLERWEAVLTGLYYALVSIFGAAVRLTCIYCRPFRQRPNPPWTGGTGEPVVWGESRHCRRVAHAVREPVS